MTEQEAMEFLQNLNVKLTDMSGYKTNRQIFGWNEISAICEAIKALEEVQQYRAIGTPGECRSAVEKQTAKKVKDVSMVRDNEEYIGRIGKCPCCEDIVEEDTLYCDCGQKLDWSGEE